MMFQKAQFVLLTILLPLSAIANTPINFCQNPVSAVCSETGPSNYKQLRLDLYQQTLKKLIESNKNLSLDGEVLNIKATQNNETESVKALFASTLLKTFEEKLSAGQLIITNSDLGFMKSQVGNFASRYYGDKSLTELLTSINMITTQSQYAQFVETLPSEIKSIESVASFYDRFCGELQPQAHFEKSQNFILVCPGLILKAMASDTSIKNGHLSKADLIRRLTFVLSHEMSHSMDMNMTMGTFYSCLEKKSTFKKAEFEFGKRPEVYADFFAYQQLAFELKKLTTLSERVELTRQNLQGLCESDTSVDHPTKEFRIGVLLEYSTVSSQLGCVSQVQNQCQ